MVKIDCEPVSVKVHLYPKKLHRAQHHFSDQLRAFPLDTSHLQVPFQLIALALDISLLEVPIQLITLALDISACEVSYWTGHLRPRLRHSEVVIRYRFGQGP